MQRFRIPIFSHLGVLAKEKDFGSERAREREKRVAFGPAKSEGSSQAKKDSLFSRVNNVRRSDNFAPSVDFSLPEDVALHYLI